MTKASKKNRALNWVPYIHYPVQFKKNEMQALINVGSKVNAMTPGYASKLDLKAYYINIGAQKIDGSTFETF